MVGINFSDFIISCFDTHQILSGFPTASSNDEQRISESTSINFKIGCPKATAAS